MFPFNNGRKFLSKNLFNIRGKPHRIKMKNISQWLTFHHWLKDDLKVSSSRSVITGFVKPRLNFFKFPLSLDIPSLNLVQTRDPALSCTFDFI